MAEPEAQEEEQMENSSMGLMSHLIELRDRLLRIVLAVLLIFLCLFYWANDIYTYLAEPLTRHLPEDAARFFTEGMQQMDALNYPAHVREVMQKYHRQWTLDRALH